MGTIIYVICAILVGAGIMFLITKLTAKRVDDNSFDKQSFDEEKNKLINELIEAKGQVSNLQKQLDNVPNGENGKHDESVQKQLANVNKLKKEIEDLEQEIEDLEDSNKDNKKKLNIKIEELNTEKNKVRDLEKSVRILQEDIEQKNDELQEKTKSLAINSESLSFIQEILSAKQAKDEKTKELYEKVNKVINIISDELWDEYKAFAKEEDKQLFDKEKGELAQWAITEKKGWVKGKVSIAFIGEFSAGKTSIVNRVLSQDDPNVTKLPVSMKATTAIPTYISGGIGAFYRFVTPDNVLKDISKETFNRVNKEVLDQVKGVSSLIQYFVMTYKNQNLDGLSILDTPGFNSNDKEDADRTLEVINECDALFWVVDVNVGELNRTSVKLIKNNLKKPLYIVINKVDTKSQKDIDAVEQKIRKTLQEEGLSAKNVIRFSEKAPLEHIMTPIKEIANTTTKDPYPYKLDLFLQQCLKSVKSKAEIAAKNFNQATRESCNITEKYNNSVNRMAQTFYEVAGIPQSIEHIFSKDRFEMTPEQYNRLTNLLNTISTTRLNELCDLYDNQMEITTTVKKTHTEKIDLMKQYNRMNALRNSFIRAIKELNY